MSLPATRLADRSGVPDGWLDVTEAARLKGCSDRAIRKCCESKWSAKFQAKLISGRWYISPKADPAFDRCDVLNRSDLEIRASLEAHGVLRKHLLVAERRRAILGEWQGFQANRPNEDRFPGFLSHCISKGLFGDGVTLKSLNTLYLWKRLYASNMGFAALVPQYARRGRRGADIGSAALRTFETRLLGGNGTKISQAYLLVQQERELYHSDDPEWAWPGYGRILREVRDRFPELLRMIARKGPRAAIAACVPKLQRDFEAIPSGDEFVGDERTLDVWCRVLDSRRWKAVRPKITCWMDVRSRFVAGWILAHYANSQTILGSLKKAIAEHGKPRILRTDWGEDYRAAARHGALKIGKDSDDRLPGILSELGIETRKVAPYEPWAKPIESFFRTLKQIHDQLYAEFWGGCPSERHEDRERYIKANLEKLPTIDEVSSTVSQALELYHSTPHGSPDMFQKTPLEAMSAFRVGPVRHESVQVLNHLFAQFVGPKTVRRDGVRQNSRWYGTGDVRLVPLLGKRVLLAVQPDDQGRAMVCDLDKRPLFEIECISLAGRSAEDVKDFMRARARLVRPFIDQQRAARKVLQSTSPSETLAMQLEAVNRKRGGSSRAAESAPSLTIVRPDLENAIASAGPAPSDSLESRSIEVRTGTDADEITIDDMLDGPLLAAGRDAVESDHEDAAEDFFGLTDLGDMP